MRRLLIEVLRPQGQQLGRGPALFFLVATVALGRLGLAIEVLDLFLDLFEHVLQPRQVVLGVPDAIRRLAAAFLVLRDAGGLFDEHAHFFGLRLDYARNHALLDDRVAARAQARAQEDARNVLAAAPRAVQEVGRDALPAHFAPDRDLGVLGVLAFQRRLAVVEQELDGRRTDRFAGSWSR